MTVSSNNFRDALLIHIDVNSAHVHPPSILKPEGKLQVDKKGKNRIESPREILEGRRQLLEQKLQPPEESELKHTPELKNTSIDRGDSYALNEAAKVNTTEVVSHSTSIAETSSGIDDGIDDNTRVDTVVPEKVSGGSSYSRSRRWYSTRIWQCGNCGDGPHNTAIIVHCSNCGHVRDSCCTVGWD